MTHKRDPCLYYLVIQCPDQKKKNHDVQKIDGPKKMTIRIDLPKCSKKEFICKLIIIFFTNLLNNILERKNNENKVYELFFVSCLHFF